VGKLVRVAEEGKLHRRGGKPTSHVSCKQTHRPAGAAAQAQQSGAGKLVKAVVEGKLHRRGGKTHFLRKQTSRPEKAGAVSPLPVCLERGKLVAVASCTEL
jgi:hypothetical protein